MGHAERERDKKYWEKYLTPAFLPMLQLYIVRLGKL
jgi:hypothetical protein